MNIIPINRYTLAAPNSTGDGHRVVGEDPGGAR